MTNAAKDTFFHSSLTLLLSVISLAWLPAGAISAQELGNLSTNRPGYSSTPAVVGRNVWQGEFGYVWAKNSFGSNTQSIPNATVRYGVSDEMEVLIDWVGYSTTNEGGGDGITDASVGVKWRINNDSAATQLSLLAKLSLPIGASALSSGSVDPTIGLAWSNSSTANFYGTAALVVVDGNYSFDNGIGIAFGVGEKGGTFVEHQMSLSEKGSTLHQLNTGFTWLSNSSQQWDVNGSIGLNSAAADFSIGVGYSQRFR